MLEESTFVEQAPFEVAVTKNATYSTDQTGCSTSHCLFTKLSLLAVLRDHHFILLAQPGS
jgi:hypothetical protein